MTKNVFNVLKTGNFYFPHLYRNDKFIVIDTLELEVEGFNKKILDIYLKLKEINFSIFAEPIWKSIDVFIKRKK